MKKSFLSLSVEFAEMKLFFRQKICYDFLGMFLHRPCYRNPV